MILSDTDYYGELAQKIRLTTTTFHSPMCRIEDNKKKLAVKKYNDRLPEKQ